MYELFELGRYAEAEKEMRRHLAENPDDAHTMSLLVFCLIQLDRKDEALAAAKKAVALQPDNPFPHYALARAHYTLDENNQALPAAQEALRLDPADADHHALLASLNYDMKQFEKALAYADSGLELDAEHSWCQNIRGLALAKLGRADEAAANMDQALALDPESPIGHASRGWVLTQQGNYPEAEAAFREALRLDARNEWARDGLAEILRARNWFYRLLFRWRLWMSTLDNSKAWMFLIGTYVLSRLLGGPFQLLYLLFALLTWFGHPIANLLLRLHPFGRYLLDPAQRRASNIFGGVIVAALASLGLGIWLNSVRLVVAFFVLLVAGILVGAVLPSERLRASGVIRLGAAAMAVLGLAAVALPGSGALSVFGIGFFVFGILMNGVSMRS